MKKNLIIISMILFYNCCTNISSDIHISVEQHQFCYIDKSPRILYEYRLKNPTEQSIYTWIDYNGTFNGNNKEQAFQKYFLSPHGNTNLLMVLTDNVIIDDAFVSKIGVSFLAEVKPGRDFRYICLSPLESIIDHIFYLSENEFDERFGGVINKDVLFQTDYIVLQ